METIFISHKLKTMAQRYYEQAMRKTTSRDGGKPKSTKKVPYFTCSDGTLGDVKRPDMGRRVASPWKPGVSRNKN